MPSTTNAFSFMRQLLSLNAKEGAAMAPSWLNQRPVFGPDLVAIHPVPHDSQVVAEPQVTAFVRLPEAFFFRAAFPFVVHPSKEASRAFNQLRRLFL